MPAGSTRLLALDLARREVSTGRNESSLQRRVWSGTAGALWQAKTVVPMVPVCPIVSMVPRGLRLLHW